MLFNSYLFIFFFLPLTWLFYHGIKAHNRFLARGVLVVGSFVFYAWWDLSYVPLLVTSITVNYWVAKQLQNTNPDGIPKLWWLLAGIGFNLLLLGYFKYANFIVDNLNYLGAQWSLEQIILPLAISFFTFQQIAYLVDSYRGQVLQQNLLDYSLFVTFFPQLIAGPIVHHAQMMPQFSKSYNHQQTQSHLTTGLVIFSIGLFKKVVIADQFAVWANAGFDTTSHLNFIEGWATSLSYTFQLYYDFSGYSDMAIGLALMFNIYLPLNFNAPYKALSIQDFWRRWHITLSQFLRDYVYIPLGGNRLAEHQTLLNLMITFVLGGIWHGASWMFVIWGALHGSAIVVHRLWQKTGIRLPALVCWLLTFMFVNCTWVFFRADDLATAAKVLSAMVGVDSIPFYGINSSVQTGEAHQMPLWSKLGGNVITPCFILAALILCVTAPTSWQLTEKLNRKKIWFAAALLLVALFSMLGAQAEFLYFNF